MTAYTPSSTTMVGRFGNVPSETVRLRLARKSTAKPSPIRLVNSPMLIECRCMGRIIEE